MGSHIEPVPADPAKCSPLLEFDDSSLEKAFWRDDKTLRVYITLDVCFASVALAGNAAYGRLLWPAVAHLGVANTWPQLLSIALTFSSSTALLLYWHFAPASYKQHRQQLVMTYRLVRLANNYWTAYWSSTTARVMLFAARLEVGQLQEHSATQGIVELVTKQLHMVPLTNLALGNLVVQAKYWLPLQLAAYASIIYWAIPFHPCRRSFAQSATLLPALCRAMTRLQLLVLSALGGAPVLSHQPSVAACSSSISSALTLILFVYTAHGLVFAGSVFFSLEQRLKTDWLQRHTGQHLVVQSWGSCLLQRPMRFAAKALSALYPDGRLQKMYSRMCGQQSPSSSRRGRSARCAAVSWLLLPLVLSVVWVMCLWFAETPAVQHAASWCEREGIKVTPPCEGASCEATGMLSACLLTAILLGTYAVILTLTGRGAVPVSGHAHAAYGPSQQRQQQQW